MTLFCQWKYDVNKKVKCSVPLTDNAVMYCLKNRKKFDGLLLCKGHQDRYLAEKNVNKS